MKKTTSGYELSSGRTFYANGYIVGIGIDGCAYQGYDGGLEVDLAVDDEFETSPWTAEERAELADEMISRWKQFKVTDATPR